jgi:hypothetical protein
MTSAAPSPELANEVLARSRWIAVQHGQIRGLTHAFGDCMHALEMLTGSLVADSALTPDVIGSLNADSARGAELVRLLRLIPFADHGASEACTIGDAVRDCVRLFELHADARDAECPVQIDDDVPAVLAPPAALIQALLAVLTEALPAHGADSPARVAIHARGDADAAHVEISWPAGTADAADRTRRDDSFVVARWLLRTTGATFARTTRDDVVRTTMRLP